VLNKLMDLLKRAPPATADTVGAPFSRRDVAVVALLVEAAQIDRSSRTDEFAAVERIVRERFELDAASAEQLIATARRQLDASLEDWVFAAAVREGFTVEERAEILGLLWEVVYADGQLARFEESLLHRLSRQLRVGEAESERARAQAFARSGRTGTGEAE
jgi:uncharacterized tellurite resistance protein B-like protein